MQTLRFASATVAARHPLAITGEAVWHQSEGGWSSTIALADLPNDYIVVPSFAQRDTPAVDFAAQLVAADAAWRIAPTQRAALESGTTDPRATTHIDYFHCRADLAATSLTVSVATALEPVEYLMGVSARAFRVATGPGHRNAPPRRAGDQPDDRAAQRCGTASARRPASRWCSLPRRRRIARARRARLSSRRRGCTACGRSRSARPPTQA